MAVIIGFGTTISTPLFPNGGIVSINFGIESNINRLWQLGSFQTYDTYSEEHRTLSITAYGKDQAGQRGSSLITLQPSTTCTDTSNIPITVTPGECGTEVDPFSDNFYLTSYSYSKDEVNGYGNETWSFRTKTIHDSYTGNQVMLQGISTGQLSVGAGVLTAAQMGVVVNETASQNANGEWIESESGSVSAGFPGIGNYDFTREAVFTQVGGSYSKVDGYRGTASVNIPMEEVYF